MNEFIDLKEEERNGMNGIRKLYAGPKCPADSSASGSGRVVAMALENDVSVSADWLAGQLLTFVHYFMLLPHAHPAVPHFLQAPTPRGL